MSRLVLAAVLALGLSACSDDPDEVPPDAGATADSGTATDAGTDVDAGTDAGSDAGTQVDAGTDAGSGSSQGSGKLPCISTGSVKTDAGTLPFCEAQVGEARVKIIEPQAGIVAAPMKLAIYLHGDGAAAYNGSNPRALFTHGGWTYGHNTLYVAALAPNKCAWWTNPGRTDCTTEGTDADRDLEGKNAATLVEIIEALRRGWNIQDGPIYFGGSSGGSIQLTASFLPRYGDRYPGVYALSCGGEKPWSGKMDWDTTQASLRGDTKFYFTYGDLDPLLVDIRDAESYFTGLQFPVNDKVIAGAAHCAFDQVGRVSEVWNEVTP
ncbi:hypothetical protein D7Y13_31030 [Corallococcus praedator]|uniref:Poly(3-hydroxybutyrate) depolymerase n=1 Tax=Corallococcus praedator TaxID=2316724 RepID=A0ABX9QCB3_9BACT|nr:MULTISPECIES: hypothetical protein [Corallococcus]RKH30747.1 hypothetical protein D7X75_20605 [Corallococcus sp. CA031C]RKH96369.1 hypothetical protein D7Y13_31030 [Corallococcus praedator]